TGAELVPAGGRHRAHPELAFAAARRDTGAEQDRAELRVVPAQVEEAVAGLDALPRHGQVAGIGDGLPDAGAVVVHVLGVRPVEPCARLGDAAAQALGAVEDLVRVVAGGQL